MKKSLVFLGHGGWAPGCLEAMCTGALFQVPLVFLHAASREAGAHANAEMEALARRHGSLVINVDEAIRIREHVEREVPDLLVCVGFLKKIPGDVLDLPAQGAINLHGALLPRYRGRAPISWALMNGEKFVGITVHYMREEIDAGPIIMQHRIRVAVHDTAATLYEKLKRIAPGILLDSLKMFEQGTPEGVPQDESAASRFGKLTPEVCEIRWADPARMIHNKIRALVPPYPGAFTFRGGRRYVIMKSALLENVRGERAPGEVLAVGPRGAVVGTGEGRVLVQEVVREGGSPGAPDWEEGDTLAGEERHA
jgi:UDP-4-amino-4-deoxy-L-arabinose formyltransferase/UDP-glucuronic acid dehydrogenase (UDP-4-keto-hexauronic acid decarboxylating)